MAREAVISTSALNAYGTRILTEGLDIEQYKKNPIVLYMHRRGWPRMQKRVCCGDRTRTCDLEGMNLTSCRLLHPAILVQRCNV